MALRGVGVGAEKNQFCAVIAQDNRVTGQVNVNQPGKGDDVFAEHIRLRFTGRQKNLVMTGFQGAQQRLAGKIKRRANLAGFQDIADAVLKPGAISGIKTASVTASDSVTATVPVVMVKASTRVTLDTPEVVCTNRLITGTLEVQKGGTMRGNIEHTGGELSSNGKVLHTHKHPGDSGGTTGGPL